jgi:NAD-dependent SIR2 family protein deacetylase
VCLSRGDPKLQHSIVITTTPNQTKKLLYGSCKREEKVTIATTNDDGFENVGKIIATTITNSHLLLSFLTICKECSFVFLLRRNASQLLLFCTCKK